MRLRSRLLFVGAAAFAACTGMVGVAARETPAPASASSPSCMDQCAAAVDPCLAACHIDGVRDFRPCRESCAVDEMTCVQACSGGVGPLQQLLRDVRPYDSPMPVEVEKKPSSEREPITSACYNNCVETSNRCKQAIAYECGLDAACTEREMSDCYTEFDTCADDCNSQLDVVKSSVSSKPLAKMAREIASSKVGNPGCVKDCTTMHTICTTACPTLCGPDAACMTNCYTDCASTHARCLKPCGPGSNENNNDDDNGDAIPNNGHSHGPIVPPPAYAPGASVSSRVVWPPVASPAGDCIARCTDAQSACASSCDSDEETSWACVDRCNAAERMCVYSCPRGPQAEKAVAVEVAPRLGVDPTQCALACTQTTQACAALCKPSDISCYNACQAAEQVCLKPCNPANCYNSCMQTQQTCIAACPATDYACKSQCAIDYQQTCLPKCAQSIKVAFTAAVESDSDPESERMPEPPCAQCYFAYETCVNGPFDEDECATKREACLTTTGCDTNVKPSKTVSVASGNNDDDDDDDDDDKSVCIGQCYSVYRACFQECAPSDDACRAECSKEEVDCDRTCPSASNVARPVESSSSIVSNHDSGNACYDRCFDKEDQCIKSAGAACLNLVDCSYKVQTRCYAKTQDCKFQCDKATVKVAAQAQARAPVVPVFEPTCDQACATTYEECASKCAAGDMDLRCWSDCASISEPCLAACRAKPSSAAAKKKVVKESTTPDVCRATCATQRDACTTGCGTAERCLGQCMLQYDACADECALPAGSCQAECEAGCRDDTVCEQACMQMCAAREQPL